MSSFVLTLALLAGAAPGAPAPPPNAPPLPAEIQDHYRDYNFVNAFSTVRERNLLADGRSDSSDPRLMRIARLMSRLTARVDRLDSGIVASAGRRPETTDRADLLRVTSFDLDESRGEAWLYLEALALEPPANVTLVSRFAELTADGEPSLDRMVAAAGRPLVRTYEIHHWLRAGGAWRREAAIRAFVDR